MPTDARWPEGGSDDTRHSPRACDRCSHDGVSAFSFSTLFQIKQLLKKMFLLAEGKTRLLFRQQRNKFAHEAAAFFLGLLGHDQFSDDAFRRFSWYDGTCLCAPIHVASRMDGRRAILVPAGRRRLLQWLVPTKMPRAAEPAGQVYGGTATVH
ncbi:hypothetical protein ASF56_16890 [Methylobacterium sp. Leaf122]|nr:hypothetical protein ASF56_16890 [Methylobacterium sp. Leaf122]